MAAYLGLASEPPLVVTESGGRLRAASLLVGLKPSMLETDTHTPHHRQHTGLGLHRPADRLHRPQNTAVSSLQPGTGARETQAK